MQPWSASRWILRLISAAVIAALIFRAFGVPGGVLFIIFEAVFTAWQYRRDKQRLAEGRGPDILSGTLRGRRGNQ